MFRRVPRIGDYKLDRHQRKVVLSKSDSTLVIAGAGSGKSLTIVGKIIYLINKGVPPEKILCLSFTNYACDNLKKSLMKNNINLNVTTFHKLGMNILRSNNHFTSIVKDDVLNNIIEDNIKKTDISDLLPDFEFITLGEDNLEDVKSNIILNTDEVKMLKKLFGTFINLFKGNNYGIDKFNKFLNLNDKENDKYIKERHKLFLNISKNIYEDYTYHLNKNKQIDFHDMLNEATNIVDTKGIKDYEYIIVDEYQDTSLVKCELIKAIKEKTKAKLLVVGDDWQSIYRFTGSNLKVFTEFKKYFPKAKIYKLKNTYRNSNELIKVASKFILKNPHQIYKKIKSNKYNNKPIHIYYYDKNISEVLRNVVSEIDSNDIMVLGRNNKNILNIKNGMTVHKSKGLEGENVIIVNLEDSVLGFPNKVVNDPVLKYVTDIKEDFPYEEERRLFYVALTRTKNNNYLLVNKNKPSMFVTELLKYSPKYMKVIDVKKCPTCGASLIIRKSKYGLFYGCSSYPSCKYIEKNN